MGAALMIAVVAAIGLGLEIAYKLGQGHKESSDLGAQVFLCGGSIGGAVAILGLHAIGWSDRLVCMIVMCAGVFVGAIAGGFAFDHFTADAPVEQRR